MGRSTALINAAKTLPKKDAYDVGDLAEIPLILPSKPHSLRMLIELAVAKADRSLEPSIEVDGLPIIKAMVERGLGFTTLTQPAVTREVANGTLQAIPIRSPGIRWDLDIACRQDRRPSDAALGLMRVIEEEVQTLVETGIWVGSK